MKVVGLFSGCGGGFNRLGNTGQSCNALSRMLAPRSRYEEVVALAKETFAAAKVVEAGDAAGKMGDLGPLASLARRAPHDRRTPHTT